MVGGSGLSMLWLTLTVLSVLSSCSWMVAGGQLTCSISDSDFASRTSTVSAEREDGSTPGVRVSWSTTAPPECVESVTVEFRTSRSGSVVIAYTTTNTSETEVIQTGLQCHTTYYIRVVVTGIPPLGEVETSEEQVLVGDIPRPVGVRAEVTADNTSIRVSWWWSHQSLLLCIDSVRVDYQPEGGSLMMYPVDSATATIATLSNLQCNTQYAISVYAVVGRRGKRSVHRVVSLPARAPPTPTEVTVEVTNASSVRVVWQWASLGPAPSCFNTTCVAYHPEGGGELSLQLRDPTATETILTDLQSNTCYTITVVASAGEHRRETGTVAVLLPLVLQGPQNLTAAVLSPTSVYLTWVASCDTQQYHIYYRGTCGTYVDEGSLDTSGTEYTFDELQEGINYTFTVNQTGFGGGRVLSTGPVYAKTFTTVPSGAPHSFEVTFVQLSEVSLSWREVPCHQQNGPVTSYVLRCYATCGPDRDVQQTKSVVTTGSIISGLTPNTEYAFQVAAVNTNGTGSFRAPQLFMVSPVNLTTVTVSWSEVQCFTGSGAVTHYLVQYHSMCGGTVQNVTTDGTAQTISGLTPSIAVYTFQVAAVGTNQMTGPFSNPANTSRSVSGISPMCPEVSDGFSSSTDVGARPSTDPGVRPSTDVGARPSTNVGARPSTDIGARPSTDPGARPSTDPGLLAGVAVFVIVLVLTVACIVVLFIWWRYTRTKNPPLRTTGIPVEECSAYGVIDQGCGKLEEANMYEEIDLGDAKWEEAHIYELPQ